MPYQLLLVEDDAPSVDLIRLVCERQGYGVLIARTGLEALELLTQHRIDLVLMDVMMPVMDGIEVTKRIHANPETAHLPVIFVTAMVTPAAFAKMKALNPTAILAKPFELKALMQAIEQALSGETLDDGLDHHGSLSFIQEPGSMPGQKQELLQPHLNEQNAQSEPWPLPWHQQPLPSKANSLLPTATAL